MLGTTQPSGRREIRHILVAARSPTNCSSATVTPREIDVPNSPSSG
jgi:hypothetical protein